MMTDTNLEAITRLADNLSRPTVIAIETHAVPLIATETPIAIESQQSQMVYLEGPRA